jgi:hypothetical protein
MHMSSETMTETPRKAAAFLIGNRCDPGAKWDFGDEDDS